MQKLKNTLTPQDRHFSAGELVFLALMVALNVVLGLFSIQIMPEIRISVVGFVPVALAGMVSGPVYGLLVGALGDIVNFLLINYKYGPLFPGYTLTAALSGLWYGLVLYKKEKVDWKIALLTVLPVVVLGEMVLNSVWTYILYSKSFWAKLPMRLLTNVIEIPLKVLLLMGITQIIERIPRRYLKL